MRALRAEVHGVGESSWDVHRSSNLGHGLPGLREAKGDLSRLPLVVEDFNHRREGFVCVDELREFVRLNERLLATRQEWVRSLVRKLFAATDQQQGQEGESSEVSRSLFLDWLCRTPRLTA